MIITFYSREPKKANILLEISEIFYYTNQLNLAQKYSEQALQVATELGIPLVQECQELLSKIEEAKNVNSLDNSR